MKFCLVHFRYEIWVQDLCYGWLIGEADERDQQMFWTQFIDRVFNKPNTVAPLIPQPENCRFA